MNSVPRGPWRLTWPAFAALTATAVAACSPTRPAASVVPALPAATCVIGASEPRAGDTLSLYTTGPVEPSHVPEATNDAERLVFAQVYETLIGLDCEGHARPALAASWTFDATKTRVVLELRADARFSTGQPVTAADVLAAWRATAEHATPGAHVAREIVGGTTIVDERRLIVSLPDTAWTVLASTALAVYDPSSRAAWRTGTGPYRVIEDSAKARTSMLMLAPSTPSDSYLRVRRFPSGDARDAIDGGADLVVTDDPIAVRYAANRLNLAVVPLPWSRTYALVLPASAPGTLPTLLAGDSAAGALRESLARDAVRAESRVARSPTWWDEGRRCASTRASSPVPPMRSRTNRIVYRRDDDVARGLAERLVALDPHTVVAALAPDEFTRALRTGGDLAYVLDLPRTSLSACADVADLLTSAPWLGDTAPGATIIPLIETRETAIVNRARVSATIDWRGTLRLISAGMPR